MGTDVVIDSVEGPLVIGCGTPELRAAVEAEVPAREPDGTEPLGFVVCVPQEKGDLWLLNDRSGLILARGRTDGDLLDALLANVRFATTQPGPGEVRTLFRAVVGDRGAVLLTPPLGMNLASWRRSLERLECTVRPELGLLLTGDEVPRLVTGERVVAVGLQQIPPAFQARSPVLLRMADHIAGLAPRLDVADALSRLSFSADFGSWNRGQLVELL